MMTMLSTGSIAIRGSRNFILKKYFCSRPRPREWTAISTLIKNNSTQSLRSFSSSTTSIIDHNDDDDYRPRRCLLSVPGSDQRKIDKAKKIGADSVVLDLEDGVPPDLKDHARQLVQHTLQNEATDFDPSTELCVRINGLAAINQDGNENLAIQDLQAILPCPNLRAIVIPKVECPYSIRYINDQIDILAPKSNRNNIKIIAAIESAMGMLNIQEIASTNTSITPAHSLSDPTSSRGMMMVGGNNKRLDALVFASEDFCADLELIRTQHATELLYARSKLVITAKAFGLQAIDMVHIDYRNLDDLSRECQSGHEMGFTGKQAIHPNQVDVIQNSFVPSTKDIIFAIEVREKYETTILFDHHQDNNNNNDNNHTRRRGACVVQGIVVDAPVYKWALKILKRADNAGLLDDMVETKDNHNVY